MMGRREQHHNAARTNVRMESKERRRKTTSSTSNELEKVSLGEGSNGVVGKPTTKQISL